MKFLFVALFVTYLIFLLVLFLFQSRLVYFPNKEVATNPKSWGGYSYEEVLLKTSDQLKIWGWYIRSPHKSKGVLLFCHGNAGNLSHRMASIAKFLELQVDVFIFDYRGYGKSEGFATEKGTYLDGETVWEYLTKKRNISPDKIIIFGRSLGGGIASYLAEKHLSKALILESAFTSVPDVGAKHYPFFPIHLLSRIQYNNKKRLPQIHVPLLIIHSPQDEVIPFEHGKKLFQVANSPKTFLEIQGGHNGGGGTLEKIYKTGLADFFQKLWKDS